MKPSIINTVVLKSGGKLSTAPRVGQRVRTEGDSQVYVILRVDAEAQVVDVVCTTGNHSMKQNVPFEMLRTAGTGLAEALGHLLKSA